jgi:hypothetical protein
VVVREEFIALGLQHGSPGNGQTGHGGGLRPHEANGGNLSRRDAETQRQGGLLAHAFPDSGRTARKGDGRNGKRWNRKIREICERSPDARLWGKGVTNSSGTGLVSSDGQRKERTDSESAALMASAATRRGGGSLPHWSHQQKGCCAPPWRGAPRSHTMLEAQSEKLLRQVRFGPAFCRQRSGSLPRLLGWPYGRRTETTRGKLGPSVPCGDAEKTIVPLTVSVPSRLGRRICVRQTGHTERRLR